MGGDAESGRRGEPLRLVVLISGGGRTLENLAAEIREGTLRAEIVEVISSHPGVRGLERARRLGIPHRVIDYREHSTRDFSRILTEAVDRCRPDLVVMAGYLRKWDFPARYAGRVMNIHPALLPSFGGRGFYGDHVHRAVLEAGEKFSGCTVHFADLEYDHGPVILQRVIPVLPDDTPESLAHRVFQEECRAYPDAIRYFAEGRLEIDGERVILRDPT